MRYWTGPASAIAFAVVFMTAVYNFIQGFDYIKCDISAVPVGITEEEFIGRCGKPNHVNHSSGEQWVYSDRTYVYFRNGSYRNAQWTTSR